MPSTIKDIAKRAGVSHSTVSRALSGSTLISPETVQRIRLAADELGYSPSAAARSLKTNSTRVLGVVVRNIDDPFFSEILQGIEETAQAEEYSMFVGASQAESERYQKIVEALIEHRADGIIICSTTFGQQQGQQLRKYGRPIVAINHQAEESFPYAINHDDLDGSRQITRHLIELGHRRIAYLGNSTSGRTTKDRQAGFEQEMAAHRLPILPGFIQQQPGGRPEHGQAALAHFLDLSPRPTALVCFNDMVATGVLHGLWLAGIRVPAEMSVAGFDNILLSAYTTPPLTTIDQPKRSLGSEAARLVLDLLRRDNDDEETPPAETRLLKGKLLVRASTTHPPENHS